MMNDASLLYLFIYADQIQIYPIELEELTHSINSLPNGSFLLASYSGILGGLTASLAAFIFHYFYASSLNNRNRISHLSKMIIETTNGFQDICVNYWLSPNSSLVNNEELEIKIKSEFRILNSLLINLKKEVKPGSTADIDFNKLLSELFDLATGGDFESTSKLADKKKATSISTRCCQLKALLSVHSQKLQ